MPEKGRSVVSPEGALFHVGGYMTGLNLFLKNTFIFDEHRSQLVVKRPMHEERADHAIHMHGSDSIYVFGGVRFASVETKQLMSLNSVERYSIKHD